MRSVSSAGGGGPNRPPRPRLAIPSIRNANRRAYEQLTRALTVFCDFMLDPSIRRRCRTVSPGLHRETLLVGQELLLGLEQELVGLEQLLGPHPYLVVEPLALARLGLEHLLVLALDLGLVGDVALDLERADVVAALVGDRHRRQDEPQLLGLADHRPRDLVEPDVAIVGPALLGDALGLADVELDHLEAALALEAARHLARQQREERA